MSGQPPPPGGPKPSPNTGHWIDPNTGRAHYWNGFEWVPFPLGASPEGRRKPSKWRRTVVSAFVTPGAIYAGVALAIAIAKDQDVKEVNTDGVTFYAQDGGEVTGGDIEEIEAMQAEIQRRVDDLESEARQDAGTTDAATAVDLTGLWIGDNGLSYSIYQYGNLFVIEESTIYGVTAYGEGQFVGDTATFGYTAYDGSTGSGSLTLVGANRLEGVIENVAFGIQSPLALSR